jgi:hypothetical protein
MPMMSWINKKIIFNIFSSLAMLTKWNDWLFLKLIQFEELYRVEINVYDFVNKNYPACNDTAHKLFINLSSENEMPCNEFKLE